MYSIDLIFFLNYNIWYISFLNWSKNTETSFSYILLNFIFIKQRQFKAITIQALLIEYFYKLFLTVSYYEFEKNYMKTIQISKLR